MECPDIIELETLTCIGRDEDSAQQFTIAEHVTIAICTEAQEIRADRKSAPGGDRRMSQATERPPQMMRIACWLHLQSR